MASSDLSLNSLSIPKWVVILDDFKELISVKLNQTLRSIDDNLYALGLDSKQFVELSSIIEEWVKEKYKVQIAIDPKKWCKILEYPECEKRDKIRGYRPIYLQKQCLRSWHLKSLRIIKRLLIIGSRVQILH